MAAVTRFFLAIGLAWNNNAHWSATSNGAGGASYPVAGDTAIFDDNSGNCTLDANAAALLLKLGDTGGAYTGTFDADTSDVALGTGGLDCTDGTGAALNMGTGTWTITGGTFDYSLLGMFTRDSAIVVFVGTCEVIPKVSGLYALTINIGASLLYESGGNNMNVHNSLTVNGLLTINNSKTLVVFGLTAVGAAGEVAGNSAIQFQAGASGGLTTMAGTWSIALTQIYYQHADAEWTPGTYGGEVTVLSNDSGGNCTLTPSAAGEYVFNDLILRAAGASTCTLANNTNGPASITVAGTLTKIVAATGTIVISSNLKATDWVLQGNVVHTEGSGTITWTPGTGTITLSGTAAQAIDFGVGASIENLIIAKASETATIGNSFTTDSLDGESGTLDINGKTITVTNNMGWGEGFVIADPIGATFAVGGNFSATGQTVAATGAWFLTVTGVAAAHGSGSVLYSDASGGSQIRAAGWTDGGNNSNWLFRALIVAGRSGGDLSQGEPWHAKIDVAQVTKNAVKAAVAGKQIVVTSYGYIATDAVNVTWLSDDTDLTGIMSVATAGDFLGADDIRVGLFVTAEGESLKLTTSADGINGHIAGVLI